MRPSSHVGDASAQAALAARQMRRVSWSREAPSMTASKSFVRKFRRIVLSFCKRENGLARMTKGTRQ